MLPTKLTIQGIFSYQKEQTIEFDNLLNDQIFGIFGSVGSGKSSILEAITYALYGQMEKMNKRDSISYNLMNLKSNTLLIDFEFLSSKNEKYRFTVSGKRNSKNFEDVGTLIKKQYKFIDDKWVAGEYKAEEIIELSYENFKRTIIIPQGKFMEFLQLGDKDRTNMLKEIFNLNKFDLSHKVGSIDKENNSQIDNLTGQLEQFKETNNEEINKNKQLLTEATKEKKTLSELFDKKNIEFKEIEKIKAIFEELKQATEKFNNLNSQKENFEKSETKIKQFEYCLTHFKPLLDNKKTNENKNKEINKTILELNSKLEKIKKSISESNKLFEKTKVEFNNIDKYKAIVEEIGKLITINELNDNILKVEKKLENEQRKLKIIAENKKSIDNNISSIKTQIKETEKDEKDLTKLAKLKEWFNKKDNLEAEINSLKANLQTKQKTLNSLNSNKQNIIVKDKQNKLNINFEKPINELVKLLILKINEFEEKLLQAKNKRDELIIKQKLKEFSANLKAGTACPVCGSTEHPNPINIESIDAELTKLQTQTSNGEKFIASIREYINEFNILETKINAETKNINEINEQLTAKNKEYKIFINTFKSDNYSISEKAKLITDFIDADKTIKLLKSQRKQLDNHTNKQNKLTEELSFKKEQINKLNNIKTEVESNKKTLQSQIKTININLYKNKTIAELKTEQNSLNTKIKQVEENYNTLVEKIDDLKISEAKTTSSLNEHKKQLVEITAEINIIDKDINNKLKQSDFNDIKLVITILSQNFDIVKEKQKIDKYFLNLNSAKSIVDNLIKQTKNKQFNQQKYNSLKSEIEEISKKIEEITSKIGGLQSTINKLMADLKQKQQLEKQLKEKELRREDIKVLSKLFKAQGFVQYVSAVYLQQLIDYANLRFHKLTKQSLSLVLGKNNNFDVIDYLNDGKRRSVKTLSGGQTFQASLSLALALAGSVQKLNKSDQNFFFLDEGFGTQDEESLRLVFDAIKSLRKENRIVGIISHVDELQDEIATNLRIIKDDKKGSLIYRSWE